MGCECEVSEVNCMCKVFFTTLGTLSMVEYTSYYLCRIKIVDGQVEFRPTHNFVLLLNVRISGTQFPVLTNWKLSCTIQVTVMWYPLVCALEVLWQLERKLARFGSMPRRNDEFQYCTYAT
jgi:hypothetical protein